MIVDFKSAITQDIAEIELALSILNGLKTSMWLDLKCLKKPRKEMENPSNNRFTTI